MVDPIIILPIFCIVVIVLCPKILSLIFEREHRNIVVQGEIVEDGANIVI